jgi:Thiopurine S-methyltransferase (TPMT)
MSIHEDMNEYARWEARFATPDYAFGKEPNYFLKSCRKLLPRRGRALAIADGEGRNGVWLAEQGLEVISLDFSPAAQKKARALAAEGGVKVAFVQSDVLRRKNPTIRGTFQGRWHRNGTDMSSTPRPPAFGNPANASRRPFAEFPHSCRGGPPPPTD